MPARPFRFGIQLGGAPSGRAWREAAVQAEASGYDVLLMPDHFGDQLSPLPALAAAATATTTLRVGTFVAGNDFRHPLSLAKEAASLDVLSDGRFELGLGAGWAAADYTETGIPFDRGGVRVDRVEEAIQVIRRAWLGEPFSFSGSHYEIKGYAGLPLPVQKPHPPLMIASGAPRLLGVAGREADIVGLCPRPVSDGTGLLWTDVSGAALEEKVGWVREAAGDRFDALELNCNVFEVEITSDRPGTVERLAARYGCEAAQLRDSPHIWVGSVEEIAEDLRARRDRLGLSYYAILGDLELLHAGAPVVAALAGT
jgi:probable F420-dependent oxidoreductase